MPLFDFLRNRIFSTSSPIDDKLFCEGWKMARIFSSHGDSEWYPKLLWDIVKPISDEFQNLPFLFSRYVCPLGIDDDQTRIDELPPAFLLPVDGQQGHTSVRFRFRPDSKLESRLRSLISEPTYWFSESERNLLDYDLLADLGGGRWSPRQNQNDRLRRAHIIGDLLHANSKLVLDSLIIENGIVRFERNEDENNRGMWVTLDSVVHMVSQVWNDAWGRNVEVLGALYDHDGNKRNHRPLS